MIVPQEPWNPNCSLYKNVFDIHSLSVCHKRLSNTLEKQYSTGVIEKLLYNGLAC